MPLIKTFEGKRNKKNKEKEFFFSSLNLTDIKKLIKLQNSPAAAPKI